MPATLAAIGGSETCRLTVAGPGRRADLTVPATVTIGELLPLLLRHVIDEADRAQPWVLQRLGEDPLDPDQTPETLDLREGDVVYLRPAPDAMPALVFDDIAAGVADEVARRADRWRPAFTRWLLLAASGATLAAFLLGVSLDRSQGGGAVIFGVAAVIAAGASVLFTRLLADIGSGLLTGLAAVAFAIAEGLAAELDGAQQAVSRTALTFGATNVVLAGFSAAAVAAAVLIAARAAPAAPYIAVLTAAVAAIAGGYLVRAAHLDAAGALATLAVAVYLAGALGARLALRFARLRLPYPPANAEELQMDIEPEPGSRLRQRTASAIGFLNGLAIGSAVVCAAAFAELAAHPSGPGWALSALLGAALVLRARIIVGMWQRVSLAVAGTLGIALTLMSVAAHGGPPFRVAALAVLPVAAAVLLAASRGLPGRRMLPAWGQLTDVLDVVTALALAPVLLELIGVFSLLRSTAG
jgi:type VII secretion integral membrane protein EccD